MSKSDCHYKFQLDSKTKWAEKSIIDQWQIMMRGSTVLTADRAWPGHGLWLKGTGLGCRGWFCWAGPSLQCYCCCCCWCCCLCSGWVEPLGVTMGQQVARIGREAQAEFKSSSIIYHSSVYLYCTKFTIPKYQQMTKRMTTWLQPTSPIGVVECG